MKNPWDERYELANYYYGTEPNTFLVENLRRLKDNSAILCIGEGEGRNSVFLAKHGHRVTAIDQSKVGLEKLRLLAKDWAVDIETICGDLASYKIEPGRWDAIVSIWCHLPGSIRGRVHAQVSAGLKQNGLFFLESYTPNQINKNTGGPKDIDMLMTKEKAEAELSSLNFDLIKEFDREVREGIGHNGLSSVLQIVARKV